MRCASSLLRQRLRARAASMPAAFRSTSRRAAARRARAKFRDGRAALSAQRLLTMPTCHGARYNAETLKIAYRGKSIADVLVSRRCGVEFFAGELRYAARSTCCVKWGSAICASASPQRNSPGARRNASAGDGVAANAARRYALRTRRADHRLTSGRCGEADAATRRLVDSGNTVIVIEHDMRVVAGSDW